MQDPPLGRFGRVAAAHVLTQRKTRANIAKRRLVAVTLTAPSTALLKNAPPYAKQRLQQKTFEIKPISEADAMRFGATNTVAAKATCGFGGYTAKHIRRFGGVFCAISAGLAGCSYAGLPQVRSAGESGDDVAREVPDIDWNRNPVMGHADAFGDPDRMAERDLLLSRSRWPAFSTPEDEQEFHNRLESASLEHRFQPVFLGLRSGGRTWLEQDPLLDQPVALLTQLTARQSLLLASATQGGRAMFNDEPPDAADARLCSGTETLLLQGNRRLEGAAICAVAFPARYSKNLADLAPEAFRLAQTARGEDTTNFLRSASQLMLFIRAANIAAPELGHSLLSEFAPSLGERLLGMEIACEGDACGPDSAYLLRRSALVRSQVVFAVLESPSLLEGQILDREYLLAVVTPIANAPDIPDTLPTALCADLDLDDILCRVAFPYEPSIDQYVARTIATALMRSVSQPCALDADKSDLPQFQSRPDLLAALSGWQESVCT